MLTPQQRRAVRDALGESRAKFARRFRRDPHTVYYWERDDDEGRTPKSPYDLELYETLYDQHVKKGHQK